MCVEGQQLQQHRIQPLQRQVANAFGKCYFVADIVKELGDEAKKLRKESLFNQGYALVLALCPAS